jgi:hypothetical protein
MFYNPGDTVWVMAKFAYGLLDDDIKDEEVDVWLNRGCGAGWELVGTELTTDDAEHPTVEGVEDTGGWVFFDATDLDLEEGRHRFLLSVGGDRSTTEVYVDVVPAGTPVIVTDIDGTLTTEENEEFSALLTGALPQSNPDSADVLTARSPSRGTASSTSRRGRTSSASGHASSSRRTNTRSASSTRPSPSRGRPATRRWGTRATSSRRSRPEASCRHGRSATRRATRRRSRGRMSRSTSTASCDDGLPAHDHPPLAARARALPRGQEVVSRRPDKSLHRQTYADFARAPPASRTRSKKLGVKPRRPRRHPLLEPPQHLEAYFGVPAMGAVVHTLNLRSTRARSLYIANHAEDKVVLVDARCSRSREVLEAFVRSIGARDRRPRRRPTASPRGYLDYEELLAAERRRVRWPARSTRTPPR